ncbi:MAG: transcriptional regulator, partial [Ghiorsea sp.]
MSIEIKTGSLDDFFTSAKNTAKEIDKVNKIKAKHTIWVDKKDLMMLLKPERTDLVKFFRTEKKVTFSHLVKKLHRSPASL